MRVYVYRHNEIGTTQNKEIQYGAQFYVLFSAIFLRVFGSLCFYVCPKMTQVLTGTRSGYFRRILSPSNRRFSKAFSSLKRNFILLYFNGARSIIFHSIGYTRHNCSTTGDIKRLEDSTPQLCPRTMQLIVISLLTL